MTLTSAQRKAVILEVLMEENSISVADLSRRLNVTPVTARADFDALEKEGLLIRTHGGAVLGHHPKIAERLQSNQDAKRKIARAAAGLIRDGDTVIISAGSTTALIGKYLLGTRDVHIVSNNTLLFSYARANPQLRLTLIGGEFRPSEEGTVGPMALAALDQFHTTRAFIGIDGASVKQGFTAHLLESADLVRKMARQADEVVVIADSSKFGKHGFARILPFEGVDLLVTDEGIDATFETELGAAGVRVIKA